MAGESASSLFQKFASWVEGVVQWVIDTFGDPEMAKLMLADLGLESDANLPNVTISDQTKTTIADFVAKSGSEVDTAALMATAGEIVTLVQTGMTFADAVKTQSVDAADVLWLLFKLWVNDFLRVRNPAAHGLMTLAGLILEDDETLGQLDLAPLVRLSRNEFDADAFVDRVSFVVGTILVGLEAGIAALDGVIDSVYGWDPAPATVDKPEAADVASRMLSVLFRIPVSDGVSTNPILTLVMVPRTHGGPGIVLSLGGELEFETEVGRWAIKVVFGAHSAFTAYLGKGDPVVIGAGTPSIALRIEPAPPPAGARREPALLIGASDAAFLEIGGFGAGIELGADHFGGRLTVRRGRVVVALGQGDGFLSKLPVGDVEVPFELGLIGDTKNGIRFEGGTGLIVNIPVAASIGGVFTVQGLQLELKIGDPVVIELRAGFSLKLGPFQASVDKIGVGADLTALAAGSSFGQVVRFLPPRGIGLSLDTGIVKGGGYLFIDAEKGEYAGALELAFAKKFSLKVIALITTKRPDGSEGWSFLLLMYFQFSVHIVYNFWLTGAGGMIGLHHKADVDQLIAGMKTGVLDDILFPENPVADAPRLIARYKQVFPITPNSLIVGPMLEMSFSNPPIISVRIGIILELANALGGDKPISFSKVVLIGQFLAQLPPKMTGAPAIVKILVDIVGFYDAQEQFLMIRARMRDSFVGIENGVTLNLSGELLVAMRFGADATFVMSAGGFHPAFKDFPKGIPSTLDRLAVSFAIGPIQLRIELYFAITSNTLQAGMKALVKADFGVAAIDGWFAFDALMYTSPHLHFIIELTFQVSVKVGGATLCGVTVHLSLEGPGEWHAVGSFSFKVLFWDVEKGFDERWGDAPAVTSESMSAVDVIRQELSDPTHVMPGAPVGGSALVTVAQPDNGSVTAAHPLAQLSIAQKTVPFGVLIDRIGTRSLREGRTQFAITSVTVGGLATRAAEPVVEHFARGQYMALSDADRLGGKSFDRYPCGVTVGTTAYDVGPSRPVNATYEQKLLEPEPMIARFPWKVQVLEQRALASELLQLHVDLGASARSVRAQDSALLDGGPGAAGLRHEPALLLVDPVLLTVTADLVGESRDSVAVADQQASIAGAIVVESFEMAAH
jgi:hypothetical protein